MLLTLGIASFIVLFGVLLFEGSGAYRGVDALWIKSSRGHAHTAVFSLVTAIPWILLLTVGLWFSFIRWRRARNNHRRNARKASR